MDSSIKLNKSKFARNTNWKNTEYQYIKNVKITEWDIKSAGLSVIKFKKLLPDSEISKLENMSKTMRTIREGLFQKEFPFIAESIVKTLEDVRQAFVFLNNIYEEDVLSIKKDAIFVLNKIPNTTIIKDYFTFRPKGVYTSFILLNKNEFLLSTDGSLEVKGISSESISFQKNFLLKDITYLLKMAEKVDKQQMFTILKNYRRKYLNIELPIETYRELDTGMFRVGEYLTNEIDSSLKSNMDISQNYMNYILPLISMLL